MGKRELVKWALKYDIPYQEILYMPPEQTFGLEIELEGVTLRIANKIDSFVDKRIWHCGEDSSLMKESMELTSIPLNNTLYTWKMLKELSEFLMQYPLVFNGASFQVTYGIDLSYEEAIELLKVIIVYENEIYRFSRGFEPSLRTSAGRYAMSILEPYYDHHYLYGGTYPLLKRFINNKDLMISFKNDYECFELNPFNRIEFRSPNGTIDKILWQNYIRTFYSIISYIRSDNYDKEYIDSEIRRLDPYRSKMEGNKYSMDIDRAVELADAIFSSDEDKVYFLKQYIGSDRDKIM